MKAGAGLAHLRLSTPQKCLLIAATQPESAARVAWDQWQSQRRIETADADSQALFSMLYANLVVHSGGPETKLLKGIYRRTWYANQLALAQLRALLDAFTRRDIPALVINDASLVSAYYPDIAYRAIRCLDLLLQAEHWSSSAALAVENGWRQRPGARCAAPTFLSVTAFSGPGGSTLRLWTNLFTADPQEDTENRIRDAARVVQIGGQSAPVLGPAEQLLCLSADLFREREAPLVRYADATFLLQSLKTTSDWSRLVWQAQRYEHILPLRNLLTVLEELADPLPSWVLPTLRKMAISHGELLQYHEACEGWPLRLKSACLRWLSPWVAGAARGG